MVAKVMEHDVLMADMLKAITAVLRVKNTAAAEPMPKESVPAALTKILALTIAASSVSPDDLEFGIGLVLKSFPGECRRVYAKQHDLDKKGAVH